MELIIGVSVPVSQQKVMRRSQHARKETEFLRLKRTRLGLDDFESLKVIGRGAFGEVGYYISLSLQFIFFIWTFACMLVLIVD